MTTSTIGGQVRPRSDGAHRWPAQNVQLIAVNVAFTGTLPPTTTATLSLAWRSNLFSPKVLGVVIVASVLTFWISLLAHFRDVEDRSGKDS